MKHTIAHVALLVRDYDEAIAYYTQTLGFTLVEDTYQPEQDKRWVIGGTRWTVAVFEDLYGNRWDLVEYSGRADPTPAALRGR